ncbi:MAG: hypothetical protein DMF85_21250 [Acidobacteria bacterium]|nr:MAG: hypothetical protein DMF85_21250 [Acidobacteriota bacterium]
MTFPLVAALLLTAQVSDGQRYERPIAPAGTGPQRLAVDAALMAGASPFTVVRRGGMNAWYVAEDGLADLRLYDRDGREVPHLLVYSLRVGGAGDGARTVPLQVERRASEPGRSRYHLQFPGARLPIVALQIDAGGDYVFRQASVTEPRFAVWHAEPAGLGHGMLVRDVRDEATASLHMSIQQPSQAELDLEIDDGSNPPLDVRGISGVLAELPWIYFEARGPTVARYGNRGTRVAYDLEAARQSIRIDRLPEARWAGPPRDVAPLPPALPSLAGAPIDTAPFRYARAIDEGAAGLAAVSLDAAALAHSAGPLRRFADVRIVDPSARQIPYVIEQRAEPLTLNLKAEPASGSARALQAAPGSVISVYRIHLPESRLPDATIVLTTTARVFQRRVQAGIERPVDRLHREPWFDVLATRDWQHSDPASTAPELALPLRYTTSADLTLTVDEGTNGALPISGVRLLLPLYRLRFYRPSEMTLRLMYGRDDLAAPTYDIALLASRVLGAPASDVAVGSEAPAPAVSGALVSPRTFWVLLALAVVVLLLVLVKLLREPADRPPS